MTGYAEKVESETAETSPLTEHAHAFVDNVHVDVLRPGYT